MSLGVLYQGGLPLPMLLDAVGHAETGHLKGKPIRATATSPKGARGWYQFMPGNLHDMGYKMPLNIPLSDVLDPVKARGLAGQYITGYTDYHQFKTPLQQLVAYNAGPTYAARWIANGEDVSQLPEETQDYIRKAAKYIDDQQNNTSNNNQGTQAMASGDGYDDARRAFFTEEEIAEAKRRGITARSMIGIRDTQRMLDPMARRPDAMPSDITESRMPTQPAPALQQPNMMTRGGVDINNPQGGNVTTQPGFAEFMEGRRLADQAASNYTQPPVYDYDAIPPALQNNPQFADYMDGMIQANPDVPPPVLANQAVNQITEAERMMGINNPLGGGGKSASLISSAMASNATTPANAPPITTTVPSAAASSSAQPPANRRDQSPMSMAAPRMGNINDLLIRMGSAGLRGAETSGNESLAAMGDAYTEYYQDQNDMLIKYNEALAKANKGKKGGSGTGAENLPYATAALDAINTIEKYVNNQGSSWWPFNDVTGPIGAALSYVPGTPSHNVAMQIDTIEAAIGFDRLQAMRDASPTGGALGQVSEMELTLLKSSLGSLRQSQTQVEFMRNLQKVQKHYQGAVDAINRQTNAYQSGVRAAPAASAASAAPSNNVSAARAIVAGTP